MMMWGKYWNVARRRKTLGKEAHVPAAANPYFWALILSLSLQSLTRTNPTTSSFLIHYLTIFGRFVVAHSFLSFSKSPVHAYTSPSNTIKFNHTHTHDISTITPSSLHLCCILSFFIRLAIYSLFENIIKVEQSV